MLLQRVRSTIERFGMIRPGERVLVGVSGGADSVALARALTELAPELDCELVLAHLHHGLRDAADEDAAFCRELARELGHGLVEARADVASAARDSGRSVEHEGRLARYAFFDREADRLGCARVAVGHTMDDQAETFLLRLLRGSGTKGLGGVHPVVEGRRIRPLLEVRRGDVEAFLRDRGAGYCEDASNRDLRFSRNRVRHEALPRLRESFNPRLEEALAATASILRDEEAWMEDEAARRFEDLARRDGGDVVLDVPALEATHVALARRIVRRALAETRGGLEGLSRIHVEEALALVAAGRSGREAHVPGALVSRSFEELRFRPTSGRVRRAASGDGYNEYEYRLSLPASIRVSERGGTLTARIARPSSRRAEPPAAGDSVVVGIDAGRRPLLLRSSRAGDRFRPLGAPGSKPLARYLMERKVARSERAAFPVLCRPGGRSERADEILWVVGHGVSEGARLREDRARVELSWRRG